MRDSTNETPFHFSHSKAKDIMEVAVGNTPKQKAWPIKSNTTKSPRLQKQYSFEYEHTNALFNLLIKRSMIKLSESKRPEEMRKTNDLNYCLYNQIVGHPTKYCFILKDKIQALIDVGAVQLKVEQKKSYG